MSQPQQQNQINLSPEQVAAAAAKGVKLLSDDERVNPPASMSLDGSYQLLVAILTALASGQAVMGNPPPRADAETPHLGDLSKSEAASEDGAGKVSASTQ